MLWKAAHERLHHSTGALGGISLCATYHLGYGPGRLHPVLSRLGYPDRAMSLMHLGRTNSASSRKRLLTTVIWKESVALGYGAGVRRFLVALSVFGLIAIGWCSPQRETATNEYDAQSVVMNLYKEIVVRKPLGIGSKDDRQAISPFLSHGLIERFNAAEACEKDYFRQYSDPNLKPKFAWLEMGLFSGANEKAIPSHAIVQRTKIRRDGSYRVHVQLTYGESLQTYGRTPDSANTFKWTVVALVIRDGGRFAVDNILYFNEDTKRFEPQLSRFLSLGCENGMWVGDKR